MHLEWHPSTDLPGEPILTSVTPGESAELRKLAAGRRVLEIGSAHGYSAVVMALAGAEHIVAVDDHSGTTWLGDTLGVMQANLRKYQVADKVSIRQGNSMAVLPDLRADEARFGFILIDGDHRLDGAIADIGNALGMLEPDGTIAVHDFLEHCCCPDVMFAVNRLVAGGPGYVVDTLAVIKP